MAIQLFEDIKNLGVADLLGAYAAINQQNINKGVAKSQNQIAEWNAQAQLEAARLQALQWTQTAQGWATGVYTDNKPWLIAGALVVVVVGGYLVLRK